MSKKIKVVTVVASVAALTGGFAVGAQAATNISKPAITRAAVAAPNGLNGTGGTVTRGHEQTLATALADLVKKGSITQAQADAITAAVAAAEAAEHANRPMGNGMGFAAAPNAKLELIAKTLGLDTATVIAKAQAGASLATIAGDKKAALIAALVADETTRIDAAVTAGKLTAAQATTLKAGLTAHITAEVDATPARIGGGKGGMRDGVQGEMQGRKGGRGHGGHGAMGAAPTTGTTATPKN